MSWRQLRGWLQDRSPSYGKRHIKGSLNPVGKVVSMTHWDAELQLLPMPVVLGCWLVQFKT